MEGKALKKYLQESLRQEVRTVKLEETVKLCIGMMQKQGMAVEEPRTGFFQYLSDIFRFEGIPIFGLQTIALFFVCLAVSTMADAPKELPVFMPLFVLALMPVILKSQFYGMSEIEAATRASGAQIILAKLILAGAANLVCITALLCLEVYLQNSCEEIVQMILYCLVPYLSGMSAMLRLVRLQKKERMPACGAVLLSSCLLWGMSAKALPWLYETSATGIWAAAFLFFSVFFIKEIYFIVEMRKEGKMYGIIG